MADSVVLLRRKVEDLSLAVHDGTLNSVITLAAIEVRAFRTPRLLFRVFTANMATSSLGRVTRRLVICMSTERGSSSACEAASMP